MENNVPKDLLDQKPTYSKWYVEIVCEECEEPIYSGAGHPFRALCQNCGEIRGSRRLVWRKVYTYRYPWWMFWKSDLWHIEYKNKKKPSKWGKQ